MAKREGNYEKKGGKGRKGSTLRLDGVRAGLWAVEEWVPAHLPRSDTLSNLHAESQARSDRDKGKGQGESKSRDRDTSQCPPPPPLLPLCTLLRIRSNSNQAQLFISQPSVELTPAASSLTTKPPRTSLASISRALARTEARLLAHQLQSREPAPSFRRGVPALPPQRLSAPGPLLCRSAEA